MWGEGYEHGGGTAFKLKTCSICDKKTEWAAPPPGLPHKSERLCITCWFHVANLIELTQEDLVIPAEEMK